MRQALRSAGHWAVAGSAIAALIALSACGGARKEEAAEKAADVVSETELREADLDMPDISIADAVPEDPAGRLAADDPAGAGALAVDPLSTPYPEAPVAPPPAAGRPAG